MTDKLTESQTVSLVIKWLNEKTSVSVEQLKENSFKATCSFSIIHSDQLRSASQAAKSALYSAIHHNNKCHSAAGNASDWADQYVSDYLRLEKQSLIT